MEFIKKRKNYLIKNSNGRIVDEKTKLELENKELILKDIAGCECQKETTKKISKNKKRIKEIEDENTGIKITNVGEELGYYLKNAKKNKEPIKIALQDEVSNGIIEETVSSN